MMEMHQLESLLKAKEDENLEFKEAKSRYSFEDLTKYCCAIANEGGGKVVLGVTDKRPRRVVGTHAFGQPEGTRRTLIELLHIGIDFTVVTHPDGRVLIFHVPPRPFGMPIKYKGVYWTREADSLVPMSEDKLRSIFAEIGHDFSADVCPAARWADLDAAAIEDFRRRWIDKSKNMALTNLSQEQLLRDAEAAVEEGITYAALILFGTRQALGKHLGQSEVVFEYRSSDASGPAQDRKEYRQGFYTYYDDLWRRVNLRNDLQHFQDGLFVLDIPTFAERPVREAILNAVSHRDYQLGGSVFIRQYPRRIVIESPGGLPLDVNLENILDRQSPRNRRIADTFTKCGLVERSGQGMNLMFEQSIQQGKPLPDFTGTDRYRVVVALHGQVLDPKFVQFLEKIGRDTLRTFSTHDFLVLDLVHREQPVPPALQSRRAILVEQGIIETIGRGKGTRYILSRRFYTMAGRKGAYTRRRGLDRETNKALLEKHIKDNAKEGSRLHELMQVLPNLSRNQIQVLLRELKREGLIYVVGKTRAGRWHPGSFPGIATTGSQ